MNCPNCQKEVLPDAYFCTWCSGFVPVAGRGSKAGLFRRYVALMIDPLLAVGLWFIATGVLGAIFQNEDVVVAVAILFPLVYFVWFLLLLRKGLTPGKMMLGLQVVNQQTGQIPGFLRMLLRETVGRLVSGAVGGLGYIWALFDKNAQAWHDKLAGTVVMRPGKVAVVQPVFPVVPAVASSTQERAVAP